MYTYIHIHIHIHMHMHMQGSSHFSIKPQSASHSGPSSRAPYFTEGDPGQFAEGIEILTHVLEGAFTIRGMTPSSPTRWCRGYQVCQSSGCHNWIWQDRQGRNCLQAVWHFMAETSTGLCTEISTTKACKMEELPQCHASSWLVEEQQQP